MNSFQIGRMDRSSHAFIFNTILYTYTYRPTYIHSCGWVHDSKNQKNCGKKITQKKYYNESEDMNWIGVKENKMLKRINNKKKSRNKNKKKKDDKNEINLITMIRFLCTKD